MNNFADQNREPKRILHLSWRDYFNPKKGGAEVADFEIYTRLAKKGYEITWFSPTFQDSESMEEKFGIKFIRKGNFFTVHKLARQYYLKSKGLYDIVIDELHGYPFFVNSFVEVQRATIVYEVAGEIWFKMWPVPIAIAGYLFERIFYKFIRNDLFITSSESTKSDLKKMGVNGPINVLKLGSNFPKAILSQITKVPGQFCFVGRICKMKGVSELLKSFSELKRLDKSVTLILVGKMDPDYANEFNKLLTKFNLFDCVKVTGFVSEEVKQEIMQTSEFLVSCSVKEGFGLIVIEAGRLGTPSITFHVNGYRDIIKHNSTGFLVLERSASAFANQMYQALQLSEEQYSNMQEAVQKYSLEFNWDDCADEFEKIILNAPFGTANYFSKIFTNLFTNMTFLAGSVLAKLRVIKV